MSHGWFPSDLLEPVEKNGEDDVDAGKKSWIQITAGERVYVCGVLTSASLPALPFNSTSI